MDKLTLIKHEKNICMSLVSFGIILYIKEEQYFQCFIKIYFVCERLPQYWYIE